jgi:hypothetical protein
LAQIDGRVDVVQSLCILLTYIEPYTSYINNKYPSKKKTKKESKHVPIVVSIHDTLGDVEQVGMTL